MNWLRAVAYVSVLFLVTPIIVLLYYGLGPLRSAAGYSSGIFRSIELSVVASALAAAVDVIVFTPLAFYLARRKDAIAEALVDVPVGIPHPIVGVALLILDSPLTPTGQFLLSIGINFFDTLLGLVFALVIMSAPIYVKSMKPYLESRSASTEDYAMGMGASRMRTLFSIVLPDSLNGVTSASLVAMSRALGEFGSISIIAYYVLQAPFYGVSPASVTIFQLFSGALPGGLNAAVTASAAMILIALPIVLAGHLIGRMGR